VTVVTGQAAAGGADGGLVAMAAPEFFTGLAQADSISHDAHKWLYQPLDCSALLYCDAGAARRAFAYTGECAGPLSRRPGRGLRVLRGNP
jgi:aromatic-L-amino-acid/L-tryptophan decarboxylase